MEYIIKFLSILIIWSAIYYYINNREKFQIILSNNTDIEGFQSNSCTDTGNFCNNMRSCVDIEKNMVRNGLSPLNSFNRIKKECKKKCGFCNDCKFWSYTDGNNYSGSVVSKVNCQRKCNTTDCLGFQIIKKSNTLYKCVRYYTKQNSDKTLVLAPLNFTNPSLAYNRNNNEEFKTYLKEPLEFCQLNKDKLILNSIQETPPNTKTETSEVTTNSSCKFWLEKKDVTFPSVDQTYKYCSDLCKDDKWRKGCLGFQIEKESNRYKCNRYFDQDYIDKAKNIKREHVPINSSNNIYNKKEDKTTFESIKPSLFLSYHSDLCEGNRILETDTEDKICVWKPWGPTKQSCKDRCNVWSLTNKKYSCSKSQCETLCENCNNEDTCEWLKMEIVKGQSDISSPRLQCIPGSSEIIVNFVYDKEYFGTKEPSMLIVQYFKTKEPSEGIKLIKINYDKDKFIYNVLINNLENDNEYSISYYPIIDDDETYKTKMSEIVKVTPNIFIKITQNNKLNYDNINV